MAPRAGRVAWEDHALSTASWSRGDWRQRHEPDWEPDCLEDRPQTQHVHPGPPLRGGELGGHARRDLGRRFPGLHLGAAPLLLSLKANPKVLGELAANNPSSGASPPCQLSTVCPEDLELLLAGALSSTEPSSLEEVAERCESSGLASTASVPEQLAPKHPQQLEQQVVDLQAEVASLWGHKAHCERATLRLLQELLQVRARLQLQDAELERLWHEVQQVAQAPEKEALQVGHRPPVSGQLFLDPEPRAAPAAQAESLGRPWGPAPCAQVELGGPPPACPQPTSSALQFPSPQHHNQMQALDRRLVEVREALTHIRRKQALQDSERKAAEQEAGLRLAELTEKLKQEAREWEVACGALQKSQEAAGQRVDLEVARMQAQMTKLGEEMSLRFLKREAKLCGFLQKSFLALEKRMKASDSARLRAESGLRQELESRWQQFRERDEEHMQALRGHCQQEECHLLEQCRGLDKAVVQLTEFVQQNQASLNRVLLAEQKAWAAKGHLEDSRAGELAAYLRENLAATQMAGELAQREIRSALELVRRRPRSDLLAGPLPRCRQHTQPGPLQLQEKSQALEVSVTELVRQVKDMSDHFLALSWRLDLQEQTLSLRLREAHSEWEAAEQRSRADLAQWREEAEAHLQEVQEKVDSLPRQIEALYDKCILHKSDSDLKISAEAKAREFEVEAVRQELAGLLSSVQLLRGGNPGRKIAEIQGKLATFQNQMMKLENSIQDNKTIQNLKFNTETKLRTEEVAALRESMMRLWSEGGPWALTLGSRRVLMSLVRQQFFIKDVAPSEGLPLNRWGVYQAVRWLRWKAMLMNLVARRRSKAVGEKPTGRKPTQPLSSLAPSRK
ncbi:coiled-coil domain-containing protein 154 [Phacochoerus africanus]|uniref:coiled-coil domain-containing protein 154 n=1 Tax=Phacochoerus africanus TaxID=41426 RepID=UPI001FD8F81E|nr:coiled-coil domain-containing protein 154 [Phacochoerus africanus]